MYEKWLELRNPQILEEINYIMNKIVVTYVYERLVDNIIPNFIYLELP